PTRAKLVKALAEAGYWNEAEAECRSALKADPTNFHPLLELAGMLQRNGRHEEALLPAHKAAEIAPKSADPQLALGGSYVQLARHEEAAAAYRKVIELTSLPYYIEDVLARELVAVGRWE